jgi:AbrB family looped-hinge helix DNA binding protein
MAELLPREIRREYDVEDTGRHARLRIGAQGRVVLPAELRRALGFVEGSTVVAHLEGEGRLVIESPEAIQRALLEADRVNH